jgi:hypothetical protein
MANTMKLSEAAQAVTYAQLVCNIALPASASETVRAAVMAELTREFLDIQYTDDLDPAGKSFREPGAL